MKIAFSGHETFVCRSFWLKKGYDFVSANNRFGDPDAVVKLGVGKNMVTAINFWMRGFDIHEKDDKEPTEFGKQLLGKLDPFLEDAASLWLLHYSVVRNQKVYIFNSFFNEFTKERSEFTKEHLIAYLKRKTEEAEIRLFSDKTYESDVAVFLRTYVKSPDGKVDLEDEAANLLIDLNLLTTYQKENADGRLVQWYRTPRLNRNDLPLEVLLYAILDRFGDEQRSISFSELLEAPDSPGIIFRLSEAALEEKLADLAALYFNDLTYSDTAGNRVLQLRNALDKWTILGQYYD